MEAVIEIRLNGSALEVERGTSVAALIESLGLRPEVVAVEVNQTLVPRARRAEHTLEHRDAVEFVTLVGGG